MNITDYNFLKKIQIEKINCSVVPATVKRASYFQDLMDIEVILLEGTWKRGVIKINEMKKDYFEQWLAQNFPDAQEEANRTNNIKMLRNSKARTTKSNAVVFLKGSSIIKINNTEIDLAFYTKKFGFFAVALENISCEKICFVENLPSFLYVESVITADYVFMHPYGRVGKMLLDKIQVNQILVCSDYDFIGLDEYLKFKERFPNTTFFVPENYDFLVQKYSRSLKDTRKETAQKPTNRVLNSTDAVVVKIRNQIFQNQRFLEQEILINL